MPVMIKRVCRLAEKQRSCIACFGASSIVGCKITLKELRNDYHSISSHALAKQLEPAAE